MSAFKPRRGRPVNSERAEDIRAVMKELEAAGVIGTPDGSPIPDDLDTPMAIWVNEKHPSLAYPEVRGFVDSLRRIFKPVEGRAQ